LQPPLNPVNAYKSFAEFLTSAKAKEIAAKHGL